MSGWAEELHPRKPDGEFTNKGGGNSWVGKLSDNISGGLGFGSTEDVMQALQGVPLPHGISLDRDRTTVRGNKLEVALKDSNGDTAGSFSYTIRPGRNGTEHVRYSFAKVPEKHQKKGIAKAVGDALDQHFKSRGFTHVRLAASSGGANSGGVVWAKAGYNWDPDSTTASSVGSLIYELMDLAESNGDQELADSLHQQYVKVQRSKGDISAWPTPKELVSIKTKDGTKIGEKVFSTYNFAGQKTL